MTVKPKLSTPPKTSHNFEAVLVRPSGTGTWTYIAVPFDTEKQFGTRERIQVKGTMDHHPFKGTLLPDGKEGHFLVVRREIRDAIGKNAGEKVRVTIRQDKTAKRVLIPADLARALRNNIAANSIFNKMAFSHQKAYVDWISNSKKSETRSVRVKSAIGRIERGSKLR